jgi:uncharacterized protein (DUF58 family)
LRPPRLLRPTRAGWIFFGLTLAVGFAALNTGNNLLYLVLSLMLAFLVLSGVLSESALRGVSVRRRLPNEIFAGSPARVALEISNAQRRVPSFAIVVEDRVLELPDMQRPAGRVFALRVLPLSSESRQYRFEPTRRGSVTFTSFRVSTRFPFGLFLKSLVVEARQDALVFPEIEPARVPAAIPADASFGEPYAAGLGPGAEVSGVRDFGAGDSARRIDWRTSLRSGSLVVRDTERDRNRELEVRLRTRGSRPGDAFERAVRRAASAVVSALEQGVVVALRTDEVRICAATGGRQRLRLLSFLAEVEPSTTLEPLP